MRSSIVNDVLFLFLARRDTVNFLSPNVWSNISIQIVRIIVILAQELVKKCYNLMKQTKCIRAHVKQKKLQPLPSSTVGVTDAAIGISFNVHKTGVTRTWSKDKTHNWISAGNRCLILPSTSSIVWSFFVCVCSYCKMIVREVFLLVQTVCCLTLFILCWTDSNFRVKICKIKGWGTCQLSQPRNFVQVIFLIIDKFRENRFNKVTWKQVFHSSRQNLVENIDNRQANLKVNFIFFIAWPPVCLNNMPMMTWRTHIFNLCTYPWWLGIQPFPLSLRLLLVKGSVILWLNWPTEPCT